MTIIFSLCWLDEPGRLERMLRWIEFHAPLAEMLEVDKIVLLDNNSNPTTLRWLTHPSVQVFRANSFLPRNGSYNYPYCWRGLSFIKEWVISDSGLEKVIFLDSDVYILNSNFLEKLKNINTGWQAFYSHKYNFPESSLHVLCKDSFHLLKDFPIPSFDYYNEPMEKLLPFSHVIKDGYKGDRYGETFEKQTDDMDYYGQWNVNCPLLRFNTKLFHVLLSKKMDPVIL